MAKGLRRALPITTILFSPVKDDLSILLLLERELELKSDQNRYLVRKIRLLA